MNILSQFIKLPKMLLSEAGETKKGKMFFWSIKHLLQDIYEAWETFGE